MAFPSLPVEIIEHIIKLGLPPLLFSTFKERYLLLKCYSLVDTTWKELAQKELWREMHVTEESSAKVQRAVRRAPPAVLKSVRSVWLYRLDQSVDKSLSRLRKAGISRKVCVFMADLTSASLRFLKVAEDLNFREVDFYLGPRPATFQHLSRLYLVDPRLKIPVDDWVTFLNPVVLPSLRHFKLLSTGGSNSYGNSPGEPSTLSRALLSLASQLESLAIFEDSPHLQTAERFISSGWQDFTALRSLVLVSPYASPDSNPLQHFATLPPKLVNLSLFALTECRRDTFYPRDYDTPEGST